ncbi:MAG: carboxypeptidase regulatory-like domain-containing protein [Proteobacteria bacterium]|nr:carboxypeptidase regulatory-like domain-containing protein [Pseudomonadota bacterium]
MVGTIIDHDGKPLAGLSVASIEERGFTNDEGHFVVAYQPPSTYVDFKWHDTRYQRLYREEDRGQQLELRLPETRDAKLICGAKKECTASLTWHFADALIGRVAARCSKGKTIDLTGIPTTTPMVACHVDVTVPTVEIEFMDYNNRLYVGDPPKMVRVEIRGEDQPPESCEVHVGEALAKPTEDGWWEGPAIGSNVVTASCDGRPALPVAAKENSLTMEWSAVGPMIDLQRSSPWVNELIVISMTEKSEQWRVRIDANPDGTFALPPLPPGQYWIVGQASPSPDHKPMKPAKLATTKPGVIQLIEPPQDGRDLVGSLLLVEDLTGGSIDVVGLSKPR